MDDDLDIQARLKEKARVDAAVADHLLKQGMAVRERMRTTLDELVRDLILANAGGIVTVLGLVSEVANVTFPLKYRLPSLWLFAMGLIAAGFSSSCAGIVNAERLEKIMKQLEHRDKSAPEPNAKRIQRWTRLQANSLGLSAALFVMGLTQGLLTLGRDYRICLECAAAVLK